MSEENKKSGITETMLSAVACSAGVMGLQYFQGGLEEVSSAAVTAFITAAVPLALRIVHKKRQKKVVKSNV